MADGLNLQQFCANEDDDPGRHYLWKPFSRGEFTYATNGHIMVRVPRRDDVPENPDSPTAEVIFQKGGFDDARFAACTIALPPIDDDYECERCEGSGHKHDCPGCTCPCTKCHGSGRGRATVSIGDAVVDYRYARQIAALPKLELAWPARNDEGALLFRFDGGAGALMPVRGKFELHFEDVLQVAA